MRGSSLKILVFSDSHGNVSRMREALEMHPEAETVCHLGDGAREAQRMAELYPTRLFFCVAGNCDPSFASPPPIRDEVFAGKRVFMTHGHLYGVKSGLDKLSDAARARGADVALFGHTHRQLEEYRDGLYLFNPGSLRVGEYGLISLSSAGVLMQHLSL